MMRLGVSKLVTDRLRIRLVLQGRSHAPEAYVNWGSVSVYI